MVESKSTSNGSLQVGTEKEGLGTPPAVVMADLDGSPLVDPPPPDGGLTAWLVVFACFLLYFNMLGVTYCFGVYQAEYLLNVFPNESADIISLIGSTCTALTLASGVFAGRLVEVYGVKAVTIVGSIIFSGSLVAAGFCRTVPTLIVTQGILNGIGAGMLFIPGTSAIVPWFLKKRSLVLGISSAGAGVGGICWSFLSRALIARHSYQWALWTIACVSAFLNLVAIVLIKEGPNTKPGQKRVKPKGSFLEALRMFKDPKFVTLYFASAVSVFGYLTPFFYVPTYAQVELNASPFVGAILSAMIDLGIVLGRILIGRLADSRFGTMNAIILSMGLAGLCQFAFWLPASNSIGLLYIFSIVYGFFGGGYIALVPAILAQIFDPEKLPSIMGLFYSSELPGEMSGGPIAGAIFSRTHGNWTAVIVYSGVTMFSGSLLALITRFQVNRKMFATV